MSQRCKRRQVHELSATVAHVMSRQISLLWKAGFCHHRNQFLKAHVEVYLKTDHGFTLDKYASNEERKITRERPAGLWGSATSLLADPNLVTTASLSRG
jgi:hypothetical protein